MDFEEEFDCAVHSIHSPKDVTSLAGELAELSKQCQQIECAELQEMFADYEHCINGVNKKKAGMLVENDT